LLFNQRKKDLDEDSKAYIGWTKQFFKKATKCLDSILNLGKGGVYFIPPYINDIIECYKKSDLDISPKDIAELKKEIPQILNKLDALEEDPQKFYNEENSRKLSNCLTNLIPCFGS